MRLLLAGLLSLACAAGTPRGEAWLSDGDLVSLAVSRCVDSLVAACPSPTEGPLVLTLAGGGDGAWMVRAGLERALLGRGFSLIEGPVDSVRHTLEVRVADLGVRYRQVKRRGVLMTPWVLREGSCTLVGRVVSGLGEVKASVRVSDARREWTPASEVANLTTPSLSPPTPVPTTPALLAPLAVAGLVGTLLALFFVTSE